MNFLGHLFFSNDDHQLMYANLNGDFVRGSDLSHLPKKLQQGVELHRMIDNYIDHHPIVLDLMRKLYEPLPKVAGIAVDLYFDHILAKEWSKFHPKPFHTFIDDFYNAQLENEAHYSEQFKYMLARMKEKNWIYQYQFSYGLKKACQGVSSRISFPNVLDTAHRVFNQYEKDIERAFFTFMEDAIPHHEEFIKNI